MAATKKALDEAVRNVVFDPAVNPALAVQSLRRLFAAGDTLTSHTASLDQIAAAFSYEPSQAGLAPAATAAVPRFEFPSRERPRTLRCQWCRCSVASVCCCSVVLAIVIAALGLVLLVLRLARWIL